LQSEPEASLREMDVPAPRAANFSEALALAETLVRTA